MKMYVEVIIAIETMARPSHTEWRKQKHLSFGMNYLKLINIVQNLWWTELYFWS